MPLPFVELRFRHFLISTVRCCLPNDRSLADQKPALRVYRRVIRSDWFGDSYWRSELVDIAKRIIRGKVLANWANGSLCSKGIGERGKKKDEATVRPAERTTLELQPSLLEQITSFQDLYYWRKVAS